MHLMYSPRAVPHLVPTKRFMSLYSSCIRVNEDGAIKSLATSHQIWNSLSFKAALISFMSSMNQK